MASRLPIRPGDYAPDFALPAVERDGTVSLTDYRGRSPLLLALFRGLYCPFCRRGIAQLGMTRAKLHAVGVETLGIVASDVERARLFLRLRPTHVPLAADPELLTHRAYGLPRPAMTPEYIEARRTVRINPTGELPEPLPASEVGEVLTRLDGFEMTETDRQDRQRVSSQRAGQFLIDRSGVVRWANVEGATDGVAGTGIFPSDEELVAAVRALEP